MNDLDVRDLLRRGLPEALPTNDLVRGALRRARRRRNTVLGTVVGGFRHCSATRGVFVVTLAGHAGGAAVPGRLSAARAPSLRAAVQSALARASASAATPSQRCPPTNPPGAG